ncbi:MAG: methylated-DNA--[protein]-cysteine S-methyltransferase [Candidatus Nanohaloarchaea archaeon]|nr:methylated-DNA--[protein]-cysteine S-methyltransferase [Candidatus Nanohaloarchaea archaeon]
MTVELDVGPGTVTIAEGRIEGAIEEQLERYLGGEPVSFDHRIDLTDRSPFTQEVLQAVQRIGYGKTRTYGEVADAVGTPAAAQAVAQACGSNPVPIIIPCHRVVAADGLGGYRHGKPVKTALLELEGATPDT